jgi:uroporphyrin-3 C-methyltransferase/uroporphyrinogen III methyltransferase/synthase
VNESPPNAAPDAAGAAVASASARAGIRVRPWQAAILVATLLVLVLAAANLASRLRDVQQSSSQQAVELRDALAAAHKDGAEVRKKVEALDEELERIKAQRADLEQLVMEINRGRDEALLIEVDRMVNAAASELQLSGNVAAAVVALQAADTRLARADRAPLVALRRSIARDLERLRALPTIDVTGIALRLDQIAVGIDTWPMLADPSVALARKDEPGKTQPVAGKGAAPAAATAAKADAGWWSRLRRWMGEEFGDLVRIRDVQTPESLLLSGTQQQLVRHQLRLRLFDARQALIARNDRVYRADLQESRVMLLRYFDLKASGPAAALAQIDKLSGAVLSVEIPNAGLTESLAALAAARLTRAPAARNP